MTAPGGSVSSSERGNIVVSPNSLLRTSAPGLLLGTSASLVEAIRGLDLFEPVRLERLSRDLADRFPQPRDLGRELIQTEWLTAFQVNQLLQDKGALLRLGPYVLLERLGAGGMGEVFKARHRKLDRIAALKVISQQRLSHAAAHDRFLREAEAAGQLSHPNIVAVHDAGQEGERYYLAMEYIDGIDLGRLVRETGPLPIPLACDFIRQAALGLHHAHEQGFVHRDIKPSNLLVAPRSGMAGRGRAIAIDRFHGATVKILDMGLVRLQETGEDPDLVLTQKGTVLGTIDYLAPEQARNSHDVDARADLYSLGCTLYHLLAGHPPFAGGQLVDKLLRHQTEAPVPLASLRSDVPPSLEFIVNRLLAKRPEDRFDGADEVALALVGMVGSAPDSALLEPAPASPPVHGTAHSSERILADVWTEVMAEQVGSQPVKPVRARQAAGHRQPGFLRRWLWRGGVLLGGLVIGCAARLLVAPTLARQDAGDVPSGQVQGMRGPPRNERKPSRPEGAVRPVRRRSGS
jgi:serine/threonine-protein kinase